MQTQGQILNQIYLSLKAKRPGFSRRAFARFLRIEPSRLSEYMGDKRLMNLELARSVSNRVHMGPAARQAFLSAVQEQRAQARARFKIPGLSMEQLELISDWDVFSVYALSGTHDFKPEANWVAQRLNISIEKGQWALEKLKECNLKYSPSNALAFDSLIRKSEGLSKPILDLHMKAIEGVSGELKKDADDDVSFYSVAFVGDPRKLDEIKRMVQKFVQKLVGRMESGNRREVYALNVQLIPLSKKVQE